MVDFIVGAIVALIIVAVIFHLVRAKRRGEKCIGCPYAKTCNSGKCGGACTGAPPKKEASADADNEPPTVN